MNKKLREENATELAEKQVRTWNMTKPIVFVSVCGLGGDTVSAAHPAAVAESDADSEESRVGATDTKTDVRGQSISSCTILWM